MKNQVDAWATFFKSFNRIHQGMAESLKEMGHPDLEIYDILWALEKVEHHRLRMSDLGRAVYLSKYNISRIVDRLVEQGLIEKHSCPTDGRSTYAILTTKGKTLRKAIWKDYEKLIHERFSDLITPEEHIEMVRILKKVWKEEN